MRPRTCDAGAGAAGTTADAGDRSLDRALAAGVRPDAVAALRPAAGGRSRRVEGAGLWSGAARACVGGATAVGALRSAVADAVAGGVRRLGSGGGSSGAARALRSAWASRAAGAAGPVVAGDDGVHLEAQAEGLVEGRGEDGAVPTVLEGAHEAGAANRSVKTPPETVPGRELGPTSAQVARRERLAASRTSSQRVRIISASAASLPPGPTAPPPWATGAEGAAGAAPQPARPWPSGAGGALGASGALAGSAACEGCSAGRGVGATAAEGVEGPGEAEAADAAQAAGPGLEALSCGPSQLTAGPAWGAGAVGVGPAAGVEGAAGAPPIQRRRSGVSEGRRAPGSRLPRVSRRSRAAGLRAVRRPPRRPGGRSWAAVSRPEPVGTAPAVLPTALAPAPPGAGDAVGPALPSPPGRAPRGYSTAGPGGAAGGEEQAGHEQLELEAR
ncbi:hypothetical protein BKH30_13035, partial [Actinomyces oris]